MMMITILYVVGYQKKAMAISLGLMRKFFNRKHHYVITYSSFTLCKKCIAETDAALERS
jgi:hypothetical protein